MNCMPMSRRSPRSQSQFANQGNACGFSQAALLLHDKKTRHHPWCRGFLGSDVETPMLPRESAEGIMEPPLDHMNVLLDRESPRARKTGVAVYTDRAGERHIASPKTEVIVFGFDGHILRQLDLAATTRHPPPAELLGSPGGCKIGIVG